MEFDYWDLIVHWSLIIDYFCFLLLMVLWPTGLSTIVNFNIQITMLKKLTISKIEDWLLFINYCLLIIAYWLLLIDYCLLIIIYWGLIIVHWGLIIELRLVNQIDLYPQLTGRIKSDTWLLSHIRDIVQFVVSGILVIIRDWSI